MVSHSQRHITHSPWGLIGGSLLQVCHVWGGGRPKGRASFNTTPVPERQRHHDSPPSSPIHTSTYPLVSTFLLAFLVLEASQSL